MLAVLRGYPDDEAPIELPLRLINNVRAGWRVVNSPALWVLLQQRSVPAGELQPSDRRLLALADAHGILVAARVSGRYDASLSTITSLFFLGSFHWGPVSGG